jgi:hypothetical protein
MNPEERALTEDDVCSIIENECYKYFEPAFSAAYNALGTAPSGAESELRNANDHKGRALTAETYEVAKLNLTQARRHYCYATYLCLNEMVSYRMTHCEDYLATLQSDFRLIFPDLNFAFHKLQNDRDQIGMLTNPVRQPTMARLNEDIENIKKINNDLANFATRVEEFAEELYFRFPLDSTVLGMFDRRLWRSGFPVVRRLIGVVVLAVVSSFIGALIYSFIVKIGQ